MQEATLSTNDEGWLVLKTPYNAHFVTELKTAVPSRMRRWRGEAKQWEVHPDFIDNVRTLLETYYPTATVEDDGSEFLRLPPVASSAWRALHLQPTAPRELIDAAYEIAMGQAIGIEKKLVETAYQAITQQAEDDWQAE